MSTVSFIYLEPWDNGTLPMFEGLFVPNLGLLLAVYRVDDDEGPDEPAAGEL